MRLLQRAKGSIAIGVPDRPFAPGDIVTAELTVRTRRALGPGLLRVHLQCDGRTQRWDGERRLHIDKATLYRGCVHEVTDAVGGGHDATTTFTNRADESARRRQFVAVFEVPSTNPASLRRHSPADELPAHLHEWNRAMPRVAQALRSWNTTLQWSLDVRWKLPGLDLTDQVGLPVFMDQAGSPAPGLFPGQFHPTCT